jgi:hypothetical protein
MEILFAITALLLLVLFYKIKVLNRQLIVLSFSQRNINKLLIKKKLINATDIDIIVNESIGSMRGDESDRIIKSAKSLGIHIPDYMDDEDLKIYVENKELKRRMNSVTLEDVTTGEDLLDILKRFN